MPPKVEGGLARQKYHCDVCDAAFISYDIKNHYVSNTNFEQLELLVEGREEKMVVAQLGEIGPHTRYMVARGFTRTSLPSYKYHRMEKKVRRGPMDNFFGRAGGQVRGWRAEGEGGRRRRWRREGLTEVATEVVMEGVVPGHRNWFALLTIRHPLHDAKVTRHRLKVQFKKHHVSAILGAKHEAESVPILVAFRYWHILVPDK